MSLAFSIKGLRVPEFVVGLARIRGAGWDELKLTISVWFVNPTNFVG